MPALCHCIGYKLTKLARSLTLSWDKSELPALRISPQFPDWLSSWLSSVAAALIMHLFLAAFCLPHLPTLLSAFYSSSNQPTTPIGILALNLLGGECSLRQGPTLISSKWIGQLGFNKSLHQLGMKVIQNPSHLAFSSFLICIILRSTVILNCCFN